MIVRAIALALLLGVSNAPVPPRDPGTLARAILSDSSRYQLTQPRVRERPKNWLERAWDWIALQWSRLLGSLLRNVRVSNKTSIGLGAILLVLLAAVLLVVIARALAALTRGGARRAPDAPRAEAQDVRQLYQRSADAAAVHALTQALQLLFAAVIVTLVQRGVTRYRRSATVGDLRREILAHDASLLTAFDAIAGPFSAAVYAEVQPSEADWVSARDAFLGFWTGRDAA